MVEFVALFLWDNYDVVQPDLPKSITCYNICIPGPCVLSEPFLTSAWTFYIDNKSWLVGNLKQGDLVA